MSEPVGHDYRDPVRTWGHDITYRPEEGGEILLAVGWGPVIGPAIKEGDEILLTHPETAADVVYTILKIRAANGQPNQWHATLKFKPRPYRKPQPITRNAAAPPRENLLREPPRMYGTPVPISEGQAASNLQIPQGVQVVFDENRDQYHYFAPLEQEPFLVLSEDYYRRTPVGWRAFLVETCLRHYLITGIPSRYGVQDV